MRVRVCVCACVRVCTIRVLFYGNIYTPFYELLFLKEWDEEFKEHEMNFRAIKQKGQDLMNDQHPGSGAIAVIFSPITISIFRGKILDLSQKNSFETPKLILVVYLFCFFV